ncbi:MAG: hypothetical protein P8R39_12215, partial [Alphaproteobacteria bacterium]|nr:hypothetical protein [Alphaproteobacteria bacterium]
MSPKLIFSALAVTASSVVAAHSVWAEGYVKSHGTPTYSEGCHVIVPGQSLKDSCAPTGAYGTAQTFGAASAYGTAQTYGAASAYGTAQTYGAASA